MFWIILLFYIIVCETWYLIMYHLYDNGTAKILPAPKQRWLYYLLQFTWGLPMNILGGLTALCLICCGCKPMRYGWNYYFELPVNFGLELGIFFIAYKNASTHTKNHEHGHSIQNIYFGPFSIGMVTIPSAARFWIREILYAINKPPLMSYDDIWFEGQASKSGMAFLEQLKK